MKTRSKTEAVLRHAGTSLPFSALFTLALAVAPLGAEPASPPKDHALFVGTSLQIKDGDTFRELVAADADYLIVAADGKTRNLPRKAVDAVRIEPGLKLSSLVAQIDNLKTASIQTNVGGDRWAADRMQILMDSMVGHSEEAMDRAVHAVDFANMVAASVGPQLQAAAEHTAAVKAADLDNVTNTHTLLQGSVSSIGPSDGTATAVQVDCTIAAPRSTRQAFALLITEYRMNSREKPQYKVHVESLRKLGPKPQHLSMVQAGLPAGFILGRVDVHVYADGQELATNLSEQRVDLTADDALRYLVLCYVAAHPKDTLPATPLKITLPAGFKQQISPEQLDRALYVTVGTDGTVQDLSAAQDQKVAADPSIDAAVRNIRYTPALQAGKPVESVVTLRLADYVR